MTAGTVLYEQYLRVDAFSTIYIYIDHERIILDDIEMMTREITGIAFGAVKVVNGFGMERKPYYLARIQDSSNDRFKVKIFESSLHPQHSGFDEYVKLCDAIWSATGKNLLNEMLSKISRGMMYQMEFLTMRNTGVELTKQSLFKRKEQLFRWDDITAFTEKGILTVYSISQPEFRQSFSLPYVYNAVVLRELFELKKTDPQTLLILSGQTKM